MAQGKTKVKTSKPQNSKKGVAKRTKTKGLSKRGNRVIAPKKVVAKEAIKINKEIRKGINKNIETELAGRAHQVEEGKAFKLIQTPKPAKKNK